MIIRKISVHGAGKTPVSAPSGLPTKAGKSRIYCLGSGGEEMQLLQLCPWNASANRDLQTYLKRWHLSELRYDSCEITVSNMEELLCGFEEELSTLMAPEGLLPFVVMPFSMAIRERVCTETMAPMQAVAASAALHSAALTEELTRIAAVPGQAFRGHPFVYLCHASSMRKANRMSNLLIAALRGANRLPSERFCTVDITMGELPEQVVEDIYRAQGGATVSIELEKWPESFEEAQTLQDNLHTILKAARSHRSSVLTVLHIAQDERFLPLLQQEKASLLIMPEDRLNQTQSCRLLNKLARECGLCKAPAALLRCVPTDCEFTDEQVEAAFQKWYDGYLLFSLDGVLIIAQEDKNKTVKNGSEENKSILPTRHRSFGKADRFASCLQHGIQSVYVSYQIGLKPVPAQRGWKRTVFLLHHQA